MIVNFADTGTEALFHGRDSKAARRVCPQSLWRVARRKLDQLNAATTLESLRFPPENRLEALKGDRAGEYSVRINDQFRICFTWTEAGPIQVAIVDYH